MPGQKKIDDSKEGKKLIKIISKLSDNEKKNLKMLDKFFEKYNIMPDKRFLMRIFCYNLDEKSICIFLDYLRDNLTFDSKDSLFFTDIHYNNCLHFAVINGYSPNLILIFIKSIYYGDCFKTHYDMYSISAFLDRLVNQQNQDGDTFLHLLLKRYINGETALLTELDDLSELTHQISKFYKNLNNNKNESIESLIDELCEHYPMEDLKRNLPGKIAPVSKEEDIINQLNGDKEHDKKIIEEAFVSINYEDSSGNTLLHHTYEMIKDVEILTKADTKIAYEKIRSLLNLGIDPNVTNTDGDNFIYKYLFRADKEFIIDLIKLAIKYGYDLNESNIVEDLLVNYKDIYIHIDDVLKIYKFVAFNGFDTIICDPGVEWAQRNFDIEDFEDVMKFDRFNYFCDYLIYISKAKNLAYEDKFKIKLYNIMQDILDLCDKMNSLLIISDDEAIAYKIVDEIIKNREEQIVVTNKEVTITEVLEAIKRVFITCQNTIMSDIDKCKQKVLNNKKNH